MLSAFPRLVCPLLIVACLLSSAATGESGAQAVSAPSAEARAQAHQKAVEAGRLIERGDLKQALALAREAVTADPASAETHYVLGLAYEAVGDLASAEAEYKKMGTYAPEPLLEISLARLYLRQDRLAEAEQQARRAVEKNRWIPQTFLSLGAVYMKRRNHTAAIDAFAKAVEVEPRDWNARLSLADAYRHAGHWDEALTQYAQALAMKPGHPEALLGRAQTWEEMRRPGEAIVAYEKALEAAPSLLAARYRLARLYLNAADPALRKPERAVELAASAAEATQWQDVRVLETLAEAYTRTGDTDRAEQVREKLKALAASTPEKPQPR